MDLQKYNALFLVVIGVLALFVASPVLQKVLVYPQTEFFTEFWLLGPQHTAESYPHNVTRGASYSVYLGVANHLGSCAYYVVEVKFRNQTLSGPDSFNRTSSGLEPIYRVNIVVPDNGTWEIPLSFLFEYSFDEVTRTVYRNVSVPNPDGNATYQIVGEDVVLPRVNFGHVKLNDSVVSLQGLSSDFDLATREFFGNLVFELWIYDASSSDFVYHERYVDLKFNMTRT